MANRSFGYSMAMIYTILTLKYVLPLQIQIVGICETQFVAMCQSAFKTNLEIPANVKSNLWDLHNDNQLKNNGNITWKIIECGSDFFSNLYEMDALNESVSDVWSIGIVIGSAPVVNAALTYANSYSMPLFVYDTSKKKTPIFQGSFVSLYADSYSFGLATRKLIGEITTQSSCVLIQPNDETIGFLEGFWNSQAVNMFINRTFEISFDLSEKEIFLILQSMQERGCKLVISDCDAKITVKIANISTEFTSYPNSGFVWLLTQSLTAEENSFLPDGLLLIERNEEEDELRTVIDRTVKSVNTAAKKAFHPITTFSSKSDFKEFIFEVITAVRYNESYSGLSFESRQRRSDLTYRISNKDTTKPGGHNGWHTIGYFSMMKQNINTITWPGNSIFGPLEQNAIKFTRRVVSKPAEPFVFVKEHTGACYGEVPCIKIIRGYPRLYPLYMNNEGIGNFSYKNYCCSGLAVDVLYKLSIDMKFNFLLYFEDNGDYGTHHDNGTWTGMLEDLVMETADIAIGEFNLTSEMSKHLLHTEPFFIAGYAMVTPSEPASPTMDAFLAPLDWPVWIGIFLSATVIGFATSILEWNSPFGLNPWGKKRIKNYTLGSGLVMAYSVLFGHTVNTKTPKSWPSKVLQNVWAGLAIFIVASYTANLAAYLAGSTGQNYFQNIYDKKLYQKRLSATTSSSVSDYLKKVNPSISNLVRHYDYNRTMDAITYLRQGKTDVYFDDKVSLAYALSLNDTNCSVTFSGREFGEKLYSIALKNKDTWFKERLAALILHYVESGHIETIYRKYSPKRECKDKNNNAMGPKYGLEQTGGLFIMLVCAILLALLLLGLEHSVYRCFVPFVRQKPSNSRWKSRNMEYINQRLFRTIMSQKLVSPQQTAREMVKLMKDRQFTRLFQKNELKSPRIPQKPDNKGLRFINLTDSLMRIKKPTEENKSIFDTNDNSVLLFTTSSSGTLYKVTEEEEDEDKEEAHGHNHSLASFAINYEDEQSTEDEPTLNTTVSQIVLEVPQETCTPNNLKHAEEGNTENNLPQRMDSFCNTGGKIKVNCLWKRHSCIEKSVKDYDVLSKEKDSRQRISSDSKTEDSEQNRQISELHRKFGTWPTLPSSEELLPPSSYHKPHEYRSSPSVSSEDFELPVHEPSDEKEVSPNHAHIDHDDAIDVDNSNYYKHSVKMKDNRVKSTIRRHAIAKYRRQSSSLFDECAVDALTKEDLLVLWKRSEIELQTKLNRVTLQNAHLKRLLRMVDQKRSDDQEGEGEKTQFVCTRL